MDNNWYKKFEEYLSGEMNREERALFEAAVFSDEELADAFRLYSTIEAKMRNYIKSSSQENALKDSLQTLNTRYFKSKQQPTGEGIRYPIRRYKIAGTIAGSIIVILGAYFLFRSRK